MDEVFILTREQSQSDGNMYVCASDDLEDIVLEILKNQDYKHQVKVITGYSQKELDFIEWKK